MLRGGETGDPSPPTPAAPRTCAAGSDGAPPEQSGAAVIGKGMRKQRLQLIAQRHMSCRISEGDGGGGCNGRPRAAQEWPQSAHTLRQRAVGETSVPKYGVYTAITPRDPRRSPLMACISTSSL